MPSEEHNKDDLLELYSSCVIIEKVVDIVSKDVDKINSNNVNKRSISVPLEEITNTNQNKRKKIGGGGNMKEQFLDLIKGKITTCKEQIDTLYSKVNNEYRKIQMTNYIIMILETVSSRHMCQALFFWFIVYPFIPSIPNMISQVIETKTLFENLYLPDGTMNETIKKIATETFVSQYRILNGTQIGTSEVIHISDEMAFEIFMKSAMDIIHKFNNTVPTNSQLIRSTFFPIRIAEHLFWSSALSSVVLTPLYMLFMMPLEFVEEELSIDTRMPLLHMILKLLDKLTLSKYNLVVRYNRIRLTSTDGQVSMKKKFLEDVKLARKKIIDVGDTWIHTKRLRLPADIKNVIVEQLLGSQEQILDPETTQAFDNIIRHQGGNTQNKKTNKKGPTLTKRKKRKQKRSKRTKRVGGVDSNNASDPTSPPQEPTRHITPIVEYPPIRDTDLHQI